MSDQKRAQAVDLMIRTDRAHRHLLLSEVRSLGVCRSHHMMLMYLSRCDRISSQRELAEHFDLTPAAVCGALAKLEADGFIARSAGSDSRTNEITITEKGRELVDRSRAVFSSIDESLFDGFTDEELDRYTLCLEKMLENIERRTEGEKSS